jgi:hypothetical protein
VGAGELPRAGLCKHDVRADQQPRISAWAVVWGLFSRSTAFHLQPRPKAALSLLVRIRSV